MNVDQLVGFNFHFLLFVLAFVVNAVLGALDSAFRSEDYPHSKVLMFSVVLFGIIELFYWFMLFLYFTFF